MKQLRLLHGVVLLFGFACLVSCEQKQTIDFYDSDLFKDVQMAGIFEDSKTFVDCVPKRPIEEILADYDPQRDELDDFVAENFIIPLAKGSGFETDTTKEMSAHIISLWPVLTQMPDEYSDNSSLLPLKDSYVVPGGRFREIYYWDSYFTMLGLMISEQEDLAMNMVNNFSQLIDSVGFIPNGNRAYYLGRSQPPFYSLMVKLVASDDRTTFIRFLPFLEKEYQFWMNGQSELTSENVAIKRVVRMADGTVLNRYWDNFATPRPESYREDYELVHQNSLDPVVTYRHLRAGAESGWDYSSRWFRDGQSISTIHTTDIIPVDLNCLLYHLEVMIAQGYNWDGDIENSRKYLLKADARKQAILKYLWDATDQFFVDYDFVVGRPTGILSLAGAFPLYFKIASKKQAALVKERLDQDFLAPGGFVTTLVSTGQQWDAPNGWAPLQWITSNALYNYGFGDLADEGARRWLQRNEQVFKATGKMMEKYNVVNTDLLAGGGEYPLQDGFGWTNGVALAFQKILDDGLKIEEMKIAVPGDKEEPILN